ncbi:hypothetical protein Tco_0047049 [Tanacetum coccineum]
MAESSSPSSTKVVGSKITPKDIMENLQDSSFIKTSQLSVVQNSSSAENHKDVVAQKSSSVSLLDGDSRSIIADVAVNNNGLQEVFDLLQAPPQDEVAQESSSLLDDLAEIKQGLQQCFDLLHQQAPPQEEVAHDIVDTPSSNLVESRQESSTGEGDTRTSMTEAFKELDDVTASMQLFAVYLHGIVNKVDESTLCERIYKFEDDTQCILKVIHKMGQVGARTDKQDNEVKNHESHATVLDQHEGSHMITNQTQDYIKNIVMSSSTIAEPCVFINQNLEVEGASLKIMLQEGTMICDIHDGKKLPQEETKEDDPSQEDVETPDSTSHSSKIMQEGVSNKQGPPQDVDEVRDPSVERDQEYDLKFPNPIRPCKEGSSQERMNGVDRSQEICKAKHDDVVEKKPMHKGNVKQSPEIIAEICKQEVAFVGTYDGRNRFSLGEYFTFTKTAGSKKAKKKPQNC